MLCTPKSNDMVLTSNDLAFTLNICPAWRAINLCLNGNDAFKLNKHINICRIDLSRIPDHQLTYHYNVQHSIRQQIVQRSVIPQSFDTMVIQPIFQEYPNDNAYDVSSISPIQQPVDYQQDTPPQQSFETIIVQPTFQEYLDDNTYDTTSIPPNSFENT
ncbi:unnamed protein product [Rhizophagus irregularis]|nr:unnamed protein product [Rhizophagus irregularis]